MGPEPQTKRSQRLGTLSARHLCSEIQYLPAYLRITSRTIYEYLREFYLRTTNTIALLRLL